MSSGWTIAGSSNWEPTTKPENRAVDGLWYSTWPCSSYTSMKSDECSARERNRTSLARTSLLGPDPRDRRHERVADHCERLERLAVDGRQTGPPPERHPAEHLDGAGAAGEVVTAGRRDVGVVPRVRGRVARHELVGDGELGRVGPDEASRGARAPRAPARRSRPLMPWSTHVTSPRRGPPRSTRAWSASSVRLRSPRLRR